MTTAWKRLGALAVPTLMLAGILAAAPAPLASAAIPARTKAVVGTGAPLGRTNSILSGRLSALTKPDLQAKSADQQSAAVGLVQTGPGSLLRSADGYVVDIRVADAGDATRKALTEAGATITNLDSGTRTFTASVVAPHLVDVGSVAGV